MELLKESWDLITIIWDKVSPHWGWFSVMFCSMIIGESLKKSLWTVDRASKHEWARIGRNTMHLHALAFGAILGVFLPMPDNDVIASSVLYYATAGAAGSLLLFQTMKRIGRHYDLDIEITEDLDEGPPTVP